MGVCLFDTRVSVNPNLLKTPPFWKGVKSDLQPKSVELVILVWEAYPSQDSSIRSRLSLHEKPRTCDNGTPGVPNRRPVAQEKSGEGTSVRCTVIEV